MTEPVERSDADDDIISEHFVSGIEEMLKITAREYDDKAAIVGMLDACAFHLAHMLPLHDEALAVTNKFREMVMTYHHAIHDEGGTHADP